MKWSYWSPTKTIIILLFLFGGAYLALDMLFGHAISLSIISPIRRDFYQNIFDDTYGLDTGWPIEGGTPAKLKITIHRGDELITEERILRCYQEKGIMEKSWWRTQVGIMEIPFPDKGGIILSSFPKICNQSNGSIIEHKGDMKSVSYLLLDDLKQPDTIISIQTSSRKMALSDEAKLKVLPRVSYEVSEIRGIDDPKYSSNKETERYSWAISRYTKSYIADRLLLSFSGRIYFPSQWKENTEILSIVESAKSPALIPEYLISQLPYDMRDGDLDEYHAFLDFLKISLVNPVYAYGRNRVYFRLNKDNSWEPDFSSLDIQKFYFRGCKTDFESSCRGPHIALGKFWQDSIKIGGFTLLLASRYGVYLPDKNIILVPSEFGPINLPSK